MDTGGRPGLLLICNIPPGSLECPGWKRDKCMLTLVARRLAIGIGTLLGVSIIIFVATEILPGDVATAILGQSATEENTAAIRAQLGLDRPPHERYIDWLVGFVQGDLGTSLGNRRPIAPQVGFRLENTMFLAALAAVIAIPLSLSWD